MALAASFKPELLCLGGSQPDLLPILEQFELPEADGDRLIGTMIPMGLPICELHQVPIVLAEPDLQLLTLQEGQRRPRHRRDAKENRSGDGERPLSCSNQTREHTASLKADSLSVHRKVGRFWNGAHRPSR